MMEFSCFLENVLTNSHSFFAHRNKTMESLQALQNACDSPNLTQMVPEDVMTMIDSGRNPDIHTRTFTNRLNSDNQQMRGQAINFDVSKCLIYLSFRGQVADTILNPLSLFVLRNIVIDYAINSNKHFQRCKRI